MCRAIVAGITILAFALGIGCGEGDPEQGADAQPTRTSTAIQSEASPTSHPPTPTPAPPTPTPEPPPPPPTLAANFPPRELPPPPPTTGGTSFHIDLDPSVAGIQTTRTVGVGQQFSFDVVLQATASWVSYQLSVEYEIRHHLNTGSGTLAAVEPVILEGTPVLNTTSGNLVPFVGPRFCSASSTIRDFYDGTSEPYPVGWISAGCAPNSETEVTTYAGPLAQFVLRCQEPGPTYVRFTYPRASLDPYYPDNGTALVTADFNLLGDRVYSATVQCV